MRAALGPRIALCLLLGLSACTRGGAGYYGTTEPKHGPDEIWSVLGAEPEYIDPGKCSDSPGGTAIMNLFAGVLQAHPVTLEPMPDIAERWEMAPDGRSYRFYLRPSTWSDGAPLTAADFVYSWRRVLDPATASKYQSFLYPLRYGEMFARRALLVRGAGGVAEAELKQAAERVAPVELVRIAPEIDAAFILAGGADDQRAAAREKLIKGLDGSQLGGKTLSVKLSDASIVGVRAESDSVLLVELETPLPYFLNLMCFYTTMPVPRHVIERLEREGKNPDLWTRPEHIVSNGAYTLAEARFRQYMRFERNPRYWDAARTRTRTAKLYINDSYNTILNLYEAGELDSIGNNSSLPAEFIDTLSHYNDFVQGPQNATYFYWVNTKQPPLDDARVRNALRLAIDREGIVKHVTRAGQIPSADLVPDGLAGYVGPRTKVFDPERARALLAEAGYGPSRALPPITLTYNTSEGHKQIAEAVQAMWRKHLGIQVEIENQEWKVYLKNLQTMNFQLARMGWVGDYPDPFTFLELLTKANGNNHSAWSDAGYEELLRRANQESDKAVRLALLKQAEEIAMEAAPILPIYVYTRSEVIKPYIRGHAINYENRHLLKYWWIDRRFYDGVPSARLQDGFPPRPGGTPSAAGADAAAQPGGKP